MLPRSLAASLLTLAAALTCACAGLEQPGPLCGSWSDGEGMSEQWWVDGKHMRGRGQTTDDSGQVVARETLSLLAKRGRHVYVAQPGDAAPTKFAQIDPAEARYPQPAPATAKLWVWANYDHDFPQEIHYLLIDGRLHAHIAGPGDGTQQSLGRAHGWTFERTAACGEEPHPP